MAKPKITIIAAVAANGVIGKDNDLPWRLPEDLKFFKQQTLGKPIVLGRKNYESIGRPLPGRQNVILTRDTSYQAEGCDVVHSIDELWSVVGDAPEVMIIGGAEIYKQFLDVADKMVLTELEQPVEGDVYFPEWDKASWQLVEQSEIQISESSSLTFRFSTYLS